MGIRNLSWQRSALSVAGVMFALAAKSLADGNTSVTFTPPASVPQGGAGFVGIQEVYNGGIAGGGIGDQDTARNNINSPLVGSQIFNYTASQVNILDSGSDGHYGGNAAFKSASAAAGPPGVGNIDNIAVTVQGRIRIPTAGV